MGVAWSHSALNSFETCPFRHYLTKVAKTVKEPPTEATTWGNKVHKALEDRVKKGKALPKEIRKYEKYVASILSHDGKRIVEERLAIDKAFRPVSYFDKAAWCRCIVDLGIVGSSSAMLFDWKTGKWKPDTDQLKLSAAVVFAHYPWIDKVTTGFIWLKDIKFDHEVFTRSQVMDIWGDFLPRVNRLEHAHTKNEWPPKPSGLCGKWCPVGRKLCDFCGG